MYGYENLTLRHKILRKKTLHLSDKKMWELFKIQHFVGTFNYTKNEGNGTRKCNI